MKQFSFYLGIITALSLGGLDHALAQGLPKTQPKIVTIVREHVKVGRAADHSKFEAGYPAAYEKAKSPNYYLAMTSMTGPSEAWYVEPSDSHAAIGESMKRDDKDPVFSAEMNRLSLADAEYITGVETIRALARPELSLGIFPDLAKTRFFEISTFRIRPGCDGEFSEVAKAVMAAMKRAAPKASCRVYEVLTGMPTPTFLIFSSVESYGEFDQQLLDNEAMFKGATPEEREVLKKFKEVVERVESNHFRLDPVQSYVSKETREKDPEFWMPK
ncbi:MAG: hypothetical protein EXS36_16400 [Pedosphaera sp.]|nr:hypothetical protein [Pedosphaera sp.]